MLTMGTPGDDDGGGLVRATRHGAALTADSRGAARDGPGRRREVVGNEQNGLSAELFRQHPVPIDCSIGFHSRAEIRSKWNPMEQSIRGVV
ncbi:hypothetical protein C6401_15645 [Arthrobacter woluwensis]|nr:hypothetical protein C6401_15645 [Arthrobacter woluwensis]